MSTSVSRPRQDAPLIYLQRDAVSAGSTLLLFGLLVIFATKPAIEQVIRLKEQVIAIELAEPIATPQPEPVATPMPPAPVSIPKPVLQTPKTQIQATQTSAPAVTPTPASVQPVVPAAEPVTKLATPAAVASEPVQQVKPSQTVVPSPIETAASTAPVAPTTPTAPAVPASKGQSDRYEAQVLRYLESVKRYPSSREARQTRPSGVVTVWFELSRSGKVIDAGIEKSSNSSLLDSEALKTVRTGNFPAFPETVFTNADKHRFSANLSYELKTSD
jgi:periplasmic protein TonB